MFTGIEDDLGKCLILVATLRTRRLISMKESLMMKRCLMYGSASGTTQASMQLQVLSNFDRTGDLVETRSEFRSLMGLPIVRCIDPEFSSELRSKKESLASPVVLFGLRSCLGWSFVRLTIHSGSS